MELEVFFQTTRQDKEEERCFLNCCVHQKKGEEEALGVVNGLSRGLQSRPQQMCGQDLLLSSL